MRGPAASIAVIIMALLLCLAYGAEAQTRLAERGLKVGAQAAEVSGGRDIQRWAVVIGISRYKNGGKNINGVTVSDLDSAADDAQKFYDFLRSPEGGDFRDEKEGGRMILLKDEEATKGNAEAALHKLKQAKPEDYFIIYIAAHGANVPTLDQKSGATIESPYFIMHDFDAGNVANTAIRMTAFRDLVSQIPAKKGLVISDTCHSAGVLLAGRGMYATTGANTRFIEEMSRVPPGVGFLSSAGQLEAALELPEYGGIFTHCLLEALRGNADVAKSDGVVTFGEVTTYLRKAVPELTEKLSGGQRQNPVHNTTTLEANRIPLAIVSYPKTGPCEDLQRCGTLVIRTPDIDGVDVSVNGEPLGAFSRRLERTIRMPVGDQSLTFVKGSLRRELRTAVEPGKSKVVEVNLSFSEGSEDSLVAAPSRFVDVFMGDEKPPAREAEKHFRDGVEQFNKQRFAEAIKLFDRAIKAQGGAYANALVYAGRAYQGLRQHKQAIEAFTGALKLKPSDFETQTLLAEAKFAAGYNLQEVVAELKDVIARHPSYDFARVVYGDVLLLQWGNAPQGREYLLKDAEQQLRNAIMVNPNSPPAHLILANVLLHTDSKVKHKEAVKMAEKALELFTKLAEKKVRVSTGLKALSISHVVFGGARYENNAVLAEANYILGKALTRVVDGETVSECETSALNVGEQGSYLDRGRVYLNAAENLARKINNQLRLGLVLYTSAENYMLKGNLKGAIKDAQQALAMPEMKDYYRAHWLLCGAYKSEQQYAKAAEHLQNYMGLVRQIATKQEMDAYNVELQGLNRLVEANRK